jgi:hypothetical protein
LDQEHFQSLVEEHLWSTNSQARIFYENFSTTLTHQNRLAAVVDNDNRGALALFQPLLYSHDAEAFIEGGYQDLQKETQEFLKEPDTKVALPPIFLVQDVLLVILLSRGKPQATCGICQVERGCIVEFFFH